MKAPRVSLPGLALVASLAAAAGCDGGPGLTITAPAAGGTVSATNNRVPVTFAVSGLTLQAPGTCGTMRDCGHVHLLVDGTACNAPGVPYNNHGATTTIEADLSHCPQVDGLHTFTLELVNDAHGALAPVVAASVTATVTGGTPVGPRVAITSPAMGATVAAPSRRLPITFRIDGSFQLRPAGMCEDTPGCGHVHLHVDGDACNAPMASYNNMGEATTIEADLLHCPTPTGPHTFTVTLVDDHHVPLVPAASASITATVQ